MMYVIKRCLIKQKKVLKWKEIKVISLDVPLDVLKNNK